MGLNKRQLGFIVKWGLLEPISGGFRASGKLLYLAALRDAAIGPS